VGIWSEDESIPISGKEWVFLSQSPIPFLAIDACLPVGGGEGEALHQAMNHIRFMISPELQAVQDRVQDKALNPTRFGGGGQQMRIGLSAKFLLYG
jgi:hypothetical protein